MCRLIVFDLDGNWLCSGSCKWLMFDWAKLAEVLVGSAAVGRDLSILVSAWERPRYWCVVIFTYPAYSVTNIANIFNIRIFMCVVIFTYPTYSVTNIANIANISGDITPQTTNYVSSAIKRHFHFYIGIYSKKPMIAHKFNMEWPWDLQLSSFDYILKVPFQETSLAYLCPAVPYMAINSQHEQNFT